MAAVMPTTRSSRSHSRTIASPKTCVYCGGAALFGGSEALALDRRDVDDDRPLGLERGAQGLADGAHVVAVDDAHVGPVELLPPQAGLPERLDGLLDLRAEAL